MSFLFTKGAIVIRGITHGERSILMALAYHADDNGFCWPSPKRIEFVANASHSLLKRAVASLEGKGIISTEGAGKSRKYYLSRHILEAPEAMEAQWRLAHSEPRIGAMAQDNPVQNDLAQKEPALAHNEPPPYVKPPVLAQDEPAMAQKKPKLAQKEPAHIEHTKKRSKHTSVGAPAHEAEPQGVATAPPSLSEMPPPSPVSDSAPPWQEEPSYEELMASFVADRVSNESNNPTGSEQPNSQPATTGQSNGKYPGAVAAADHFRCQHCSSPALPPVRGLNSEIFCSDRCLGAYNLKGITAPPPATLLTEPELLDDEALKDMFNTARLAYRKHDGNTMGNRPEFQNFVAKNKKTWQGIVPKIAAWIAEDNAYRDVMARDFPDEFVAQKKNFKTWINNDGWEANIPKAPKAPATATMVLKR